MKEGTSAHGTGSTLLQQGAFLKQHVNHMLCMLIGYQILARVEGARCGSSLHTLLGICMPYSPEGYVAQRGLVGDYVHLPELTNLLKPGYRGTGRRHNV